MKKHFSNQQALLTDRARYLWLVLGTTLSFLAVSGRWELSLAAWLSPLLLLRFTRTIRPLIGCFLAWLVQVSTMLIFLAESGLLHPGWIVVFPLFGTVLTLPYLLDRLLAPRLSQVSLVLASLLFPCCQAACEYLISFTPYGGLISLAYTQYGNLPLLQLISVTGIYGVSFIVAWFASVGNGIWERHFAWPRIRPLTLLYSGALVLVLLFGCLRLTFFAPSSQTVRIAGISAAASTSQNTPSPREMMQMVQSNPAHLRALLAALDNEMLNRTQAEARAGAKIVVWPEVGAQVLASDKASLLTQAAALARTEHIYLDMGLGVFQPPATIYDQAILIDPQGRILSTYNKVHPVPGLDPFGPSENQPPVVETPYGRLSTAICFDADFPPLMQEAGSQGVDIMLLPSNDWQASDPWHSQNATFRAIENGYSLVRQASNGLAITIDDEGYVLAATDYFTTDQQTMIAYVPVKGTWTLYSRVGDLFAWLCLAEVLALAGMGVWQRKQAWTAVDADLPLEGSAFQEGKNKATGPTF
ncbi:apolipoprotein N-acyltransferase [Reticulibacter mediterranei]|uniref:Apolipoprotein N-acyltransferase n=1 Tax=Reticulibacter mediterranei TaxID=2778369 RepID=A0A8J3IPZ9_9CHLR|nr:nitrilase-related carbon-nitrogen hydrolase [Reticulibacter mediterranei]GHO99824.1 apolipoprotein N-acyltransferase [Reticulibacter mediterranei]